jgi:hypothetical protein
MATQLVTSRILLSSIELTIAFLHDSVRTFRYKFRNEGVPNKQTIHNSINVLKSREHLIDKERRT